MYFGNKTIRVHLLKGILGLIALYISINTISRTVWPSIILIPVVLYLLKGCPACWTMGLIETIVMAVHKRNERKLKSTSKSVVALSVFLLGPGVTDVGYSQSQNPPPSMYEGIGMRVPSS